MLQKLKDSKYWLLAIVVAVVVTFIVTKNMAPAKIVTKTEFVEVIKTKVEYVKAKETSKKKVLITNADGSSTLTETTDTKTAEYLQMVQDLQKQVKQEQTIRNNLARVNVLATYGSDEKPALEVNGSYSMFGGKFEKFVDANWRAGVGLGFNF